MKIAVACDHAGFQLKWPILEKARAAGYEVFDLGTDSIDPVDYPDYAEKLGHFIQSGQAERGILLCGSGVGACITANKYLGFVFVNTLVPIQYFFQHSNGVFRYNDIWEFTKYKGFIGFHVMLRQKGIWKTIEILL